MKLIIAFLSFLLFENVFSQQPEVQSNPISEIGQCDGMAVLINPYLADSWVWYDYNENILQYGGDTLSGLCSGNYFVYFNGETSGPGFYIGTPNYPNDCAEISGFGVVNMLITDVSSASSCDGSVKISIIASFNGPYNLDLQNGVLGTTTNLGFSNVDTLENICAGTYEMIITDAIGNSCSRVVVFGGNIDTINNNNFNAIIATLNVSQTDVCDGLAAVSMQTGTAPFLFNNSNGSSNTTGIFSDLCEGIHTVVVTDANGLTASLSYLISGPTNSSYGGFPNGGTTVLDSLYSGLLENCDIDYASVDTVMVDSFTAHGTDSVTVVWAVHSGNEILYITEVYQLTQGNGVYQVILTVYCPGRIEGNYWYASAYIQVGPLSVEELSSNEAISISQLIQTGEILISFEQQDAFELKVYDITGKLVYDQTHNPVSNFVFTMENMSKGHYFVEVKLGQNSQKKMICKF